MLIVCLCCFCRKLHSRTGATTATPTSHVPWTQRTSGECLTTVEISFRECTCGSTSSCDNAVGGLAAVGGDMAKCGGVAEEGEEPMGASNAYCTHGGVGVGWGKTRRTHRAQTINPHTKELYLAALSPIHDHGVQKVGGVTQPEVPPTFGCGEGACLAASTNQLPALAPLLSAPASSASHPRLLPLLAVMSVCMSGLTGKQILRMMRRSMVCHYTCGGLPQVKTIED